MMYSGARVFVSSCLSVERTIGETDAVADMKHDDHCNPPSSSSSSSSSSDGPENNAISDTPAFVLSFPFLSFPFLSPSAPTPACVQVKDTLSSMYAHVSQLSSGPITAGGGDDDDKDDEDTAYVSDNFSIVVK